MSRSHSAARQGPRRARAAGAQPRARSARLLRAAVLPLLAPAAPQLGPGAPRPGRGALPHATRTDRCTRGASRAGGSAARRAAGGLPRREGAMIFGTLEVCWGFQRSTVLAASALLCAPFSCGACVITVLIYESRHWLKIAGAASCNACKRTVPEQPSVFSGVIVMYRGSRESGARRSTQRGRVPMGVRVAALSVGFTQGQNVRAEGSIRDN